MRIRRDRPWVRSVLPVLAVAGVAVALGFALGMARPQRVRFAASEGHHRP
ncbi:hypothetical protein ACQBAR_17635 [Propionibacteriaceae bacterium Y1685]